MTAREYRSSSHPVKVKEFAELFEEYDRLFGVFLQITDAAEGGEHTDWYGLEARILMLRRRVTVLTDTMQMVMLRQSARRREIRKRQAIA